MSINNSNQEVLKEEVLNEITFEEYLETLNDEQSVLEEGMEELYDSDMDINISDEDINEQTLKFLKLHDKRKNKRDINR